MEDASATEKLQAELDGVNACIVCIANRQPGRRYPELRSRWASSGIKVIEQAMQAAGVKRLVLVNSMGVYEDYLPSSSFWSVCTTMCMMLLLACRCQQLPAIWAPSKDALMGCGAH